MAFVLSIHSDWVPLTEAQQQDLRDRKKVLVKGLKDANGKVFDAQVQVNGEKNKLGFFREKVKVVDVKVEEKVAEKSVEKKGKGRKV